MRMLLAVRDRMPVLCQSFLAQALKTPAACWKASLKSV